MKKLVVALSVALVLGYIPLIWMESNTPVLTSDQAGCASEVVTIMIDNPLERLVTRQVLVEPTEKGAILIKGYTLFGIPVSNIAADCETGSAQRR